MTTRAITRLVTVVAIGIIVSLLAINLVQAQRQSFPSSDFGDPATCGQCHTEIYEQWSETILSQAYLDPFYRAEMEEAVEATDGALSAFCIKCHSPIGVMAGEHLPVDGSNMSDVAVRGVSCDFCHTITGLDGISNGNYLNTPGPIKRGPFDDSVSPAHGTAYSILHTRSEICGICHDIYQPTTGVRLEATYFEWREGPYGKQGITCQDCHMTPGPGVTKPNPGKAAIQGPERGHIYTHHFVGGNALYGNFELAVERLRAAAQLAFEPPAELAPGQTANLSVIVRNVGAGHYLPTSLTYIREMWLDVAVNDADGNQLAAKQVMYNTILENAEGIHDGSVPSWEAVAIYSDYRIPPGEQVIETVEMDIPADARGPLHVEAVLNYRSASPEKTAKYGLPEFPIIEMTRETTQLALGAAQGEVRAVPASIANSLWWIATLLLIVPTLLISFAKQRS